MLGTLQGLTENGTSAAMQMMIDGLKKTNLYSGKVSYWNWNYAPMTISKPGAPGQRQVLNKDFLFMPELWGVEAADPKYVRTANEANFLDSDGQVSPATMADIFLGSNEPDIIGSCIGDMMGSCTAPCHSAGCPVAHLFGKTPRKANAQGECDCWSDSYATGVGFWPVPGCTDWQPLPNLFVQPATCLPTVMAQWKKTAATVVAKGYKYLVAPLVAVNMDWQAKFVEAACRGCTEVSCGCPTHVGWHFYASDCQPEKGGYADFQTKIDKTKALMEKFPHLQGAIVNEVGMLNCAMDTPNATCVPNGPAQKYPADKQPNNACPATAAMPKGLGTFLEKLLLMVGQAVTADGRRVVVSFTWFNENMDGGTYNLRLFNDDGSVNELGRSYISACQAWAKM